MSVETTTNAISVKDVTKIYRLYEKPIDRLKMCIRDRAMGTSWTR